MRNLLLSCGLVLIGLTTTLRADEPLLLRYKAEKGDKAVYRTTSETKQKQTINNLNFETTTTQDDITSRTVENADPDKLTFKLKNERLKTKMSLGPAGTFEFDSQSTEREKGSLIAGLFLPVFERISGSEYETVIDSRGFVVEVKGYAELFADLVKENPIVGQMVGGGTNDGAKTMVQGSFLMFGEKPVSPGDTWEVPFEIDQAKIGKLKGKHTYHYDGPEKVGDIMAVKLSVSSELSVDVSVDFMGAQAAGTISASNSSGTVLFDPAAGKLLSSKTSITMSGQLNLTVNGMNIPMQTETTETTTRQLLDKLPE